ncbi:energy transducer TonB [Neptunomonas marina]|uniref:Protein TonB n=1 Tax=Neptunomonas marina TaxID=1815562 RepID=A0A437QA73_9GAMM|nr:energy transducer TonB [Neptunomonas marina]MCV6605670.1 energy transducer TonB [Porticoccaceae bacterium]RVU31339.1 energy transducer TonB [Neptunomonas marina]
MLRMMLALPIGVLLASLLFYCLALTTTMAAQWDDTPADTVNFDFLLVERNSEVEVRRRQRPPEPEQVLEQVQPDIPPPPKPPLPQVSATRLDVSVPDIDVSVNVSLNTMNALPVPAPAPVVAAPAPAISLEANPTITRQVPPRYPQRALRRKQEGRVVVELLVTAQGTVEPGSIKIVSSNPKGVFDRAVQRAVQRWQFQKKVVNGQAVPFRVRQELEFKLER